MSDDLDRWFAQECKKDRRLIWAYRRVHYRKLAQVYAWKAVSCVRRCLSDRQAP